MGNLYDTVIDMVAAKVPGGAEAGGDYIGEDGLLYCGKCRTRKQYQVEVMGRLRNMPVMCECQREKQEVADREEAERVRMRTVERMRRSCFYPATELEGWRFGVDNREKPRTSEAMRRYAERWDNMRAQSMGLLLYGPVGVGKSFFAACIANELIERGIPARMTSFPKIVNTMQGMYGGRQEYLDRLVSYPLLVIDDLGVERDSDYMLEMVYSVVNARYLTGLPLIVTTNIPIEEIKEPADLKYQRIYDRILERCHPVKIEGKSLRREAVKTKFAERNKLLGL